MFFNLFKNKSSNKETSDNEIESLESTPVNFKEIQSSQSTDTDHSNGQLSNEILNDQNSAKAIDNFNSTGEDSSQERSAVTDILLASHDDVTAAYKIFLGRLPESSEVIEQRVGRPIITLLVDFISSDEFLTNKPKATLILALAKKILNDMEMKVQEVANIKDENA